MKKMITILALFPLMAFADITPKIPSQDTSYLEDAYPVFLNNCASCHNANTPDRNWLDQKTATKNKQLIFNRVFLKGDMPLMLKWFRIDERESLKKWLLKNNFPFENPEIEPKEKPNTK